MPAPMEPTLPMLDMLDTHTAMVPTHTTTAMLDTPMLPQSPMLLPIQLRLCWIPLCC